MNDETLFDIQRDQQNRSDGIAPARGAVFGLAFGACFWLLAFAAVACWKIAA
jgi:hypothetical protein